MTDLAQTAPVTAWFRFDTKAQAYTFNHIEDGWSQQSTPHDPHGKRWQRGVWHRSHGQLQPGGRFGSRLLVLHEAAPSNVQAPDTESP